MIDEKGWDAATLAAWRFIESKAQARLAAEAAITAYLASVSAAPEGWKMVPVYPHDGAYQAFKDTAEHSEPNMEHFTWSGDFGNFAYAWAKAVESAPPRPEPKP